MTEFNELTHSPEEVDAFLEKEKKAELKRHEQLEDIRQTLSTVHGRRLFWRVLSIDRKSVV